MTGKIRSMSAVEDRIPPVARGRWTSAPARVDTAIGTKPSAATSALVRIGRSANRAASCTAATGASPPASNWRSVDAITTPLSTATPPSDEPNRRWNREGEPAHEQRQHRAEQPERHAGEHRQRVSRPAEHQVEHAEDDAERDGYDQEQPVFGAREVLELAAPAQVVPGWYLHVALDAGARLIHIAH